ncbi:MAG: filamentous hemagglutinin N-terminal domain-containing protein [Magnetococcales bacterium]|nr:filamentous hemagglutinin N-terminal domain-containing protein [Magnetococcales bacterium]
MNKKTPHANIHPRSSRDGNRFHPRPLPSPRTAKHPFTRPHTMLLAALMAAWSPVACADPPNPTQLPVGGQVVNGSGQIMESGANMTVNQQTPSMITEWRSFDIGKDAAVRFVQPSAEATALNRVRSADPSQIFGTLSANGRVILVNPSGVYFSPSARVDAAGIAASALNMTNEDFNSGRYRFAGGEGKVINAGEIAAKEGGFVALVGAEVDNEGVIRAQSGQAAMAAGREVTLNLAGNGLIGVKVDTAGDKARVRNTGQVIADGGRVWMTAKTAAPALAQAVNQSGVVQADSLAMRNGEIWIEGDGGDVHLGGTTQARGTDPGEKGGRIIATGREVVVASEAKVDASGKDGGGTVMIGGGWQGKDPAIPEARRVTVAKKADINARARDKGDGGTVVLWSRDSTNHEGTITAGGAGTGAGGKVETSSRGELGVSGQVQAATPGGDGGEWLLDPYNLTISTAVSSNVDAGGFEAANTGANVQASTIESAINGGTDVTLSTATAGGESGNITINSDISKTSGAAAKITFSAANDITLATGADISSTTGALSLDFGTTSTTTGTITLNGTLATNGGAVNFYKPTVLGHATPVSTKITETSTTTSGNITFYQSVSLAAPGYAVTLSATGPESGGSYTGNGGAIDFQSNIASSMPSSPAVLWSQALTVDTSGVTPGNITLGSASGNSVGGSAANTQLKSLTLTGPTSVTLNSGTINLMDVSGNVLVASSTLGTPAIKLYATDTVVNVTGGTRAGVSGYADYKQETFDFNTPNNTARTLTINADRSIKIKNRSIDGTTGAGTLTVSLNPFVATGATGGGIYLNSATIKSNGGAINLGTSSAFATGYGSDEDGVTDGIYLLNGKLLSSNGNVSLYGKAPLTNDAGSGIRLSGAQTDLNSGTGNLVLDGRVTVATNAGNKDGLIIGEGGSSRVTLQASGAGTITLNGDGSYIGTNPTGGSRYDGVIISSKALIKSATGNITITGKGGGGDQTFLSENHGIRIEDTNTAITSTSGNISLTGTYGGKTTFTTGENSYGIYAKGQTMYLGTANYAAIDSGDVNSGISASGIITLTADSMEFVNSSSLHLKVASSGELRIVPETASRDIQFHSDPSSPTLNEDSSVVGKLYLGSNWFNGGSLSIFQAGFGNTGYGTAGTGATGAVTIGRTDGSGTLTVADATTIRDNTTLLMGNTTGNIKVNATLTVQGSSNPTARILTMDTAAGGAGSSAITVDQMLLLGTGDYVFTGSNLLGTLSASLTGTTTGHLTVNNAQALTIGSITSEGLDTVRTATGIVANSNTTSNQINVGTTSGALTIAQSIDSGNKGVTALYATHATTGGVVETGSAIVTAGSLYVNSGGVLSQLRNDNVIKQAASDGLLAATATNGLEFKNATAAGGIQVGRVSYNARSSDSSGTVTTTATNKDGISSSGAVALWLPSGNLTQETTANGTVRQGDIQATTLSLKVDSGYVTLDNTTNQIGTLAAVLGGAGQVISVMDADGLTVGSITSTVTGASTTVSGITTNLGDVILKSSSNSTSTTGNTELTHSIDTTNGGAIGSGAIVRLASGKGAVTESSTAIVKAKSLLVDAVSTSSLDNLNEIYDSTVGTERGILAANISGSSQGLKFKNVRSLEIGTVSAAHGVGATSGITATTGEATVTLLNAATTNDLTQTQLVKAGGLKTDVDTGKVLLNLITGGTTNEIGTLSSVMSGANKDYTLNEKDGLTIGTVNGTSGITTASGGKIAIATKGDGGGSITVTRNVTAGGSGTVDLRANGSTSDIAINPASGQTATIQSTGGGTLQLYAGQAITTTTANGTGTELETSGNVLLQTGSGVGSDSNRIEIASAAKLAATAGNTWFVRKLGTTSDLEIGSVTALDFNGQTTFVVGPSSLNGLATTANNGNITLTTQGGDLTITQAVTAHGSGYVDVRTANAGNLGDIRINNAATVSSTSGTIQLIAGNTLTTDSANGTTTEILTTGTVLVEAGLSAGTDSNRIELGNVSLLAARTLTNGADSHLWLRKLGSTNDLEAGSATVQNSASTLDNAISATGQTTVANAVATVLKGLSTTANNGNITLTTQGGDLTLTQLVTAHGSGYVDLRTANTGNLGDIAITNGATVSSTSGTVQIIAGNTLTTDSLNGTTTEIATTGSLLLEAGLSVGTDSKRIEMGNASLLAARTLANGADSHLWLRKLGSGSNLEVGTVTVQNSASTLDHAVSPTGQTTVTGGKATALKGLSTTANNGNITLTTQGGDLTLTQLVTAHGSGYVDLRTANAGNLGDIAINNGVTVSSTSGTVQIIAGNTLTTDSGNGTTTEIQTGGHVLLESGLRIGTDSNRIELGGTVKLAARTLSNGADSDLWLRKLGSTADLELGTVTVQNSASTLDNAVSATGQTTVANLVATELKGLSTTANSGDITLSTQGGDLSVTQNLTAHGSGAIDLRTANTGNLGDIAINNGATISSTSGTVQIVAGNTLVTDSANGTTTEIATTGNVLLDVGLAVGSDSNRIELGNVAILAARTLTNGAGSHLWLRKLGSASNLEVGTVAVHNSASTLDNAVAPSGQTTVANAVATHLKGLSTTANNGMITLTTQGGDLTVTQAITAHGSGAIDIRTANAGNLGDIAINNGATISSTSGVVQMIAGNTLTTDSANGTTSEISTLGSVLLEAGLALGSDGNRIELAGTPLLAARTLANGSSGNHLWLRKLGETGDLEVGAVTIQNSASTLDNAVSATGQTTVANAVATVLKGISTTANHGAITLTTQGGDLSITQAITAHGSGAIDIRTANAGNRGDIAINNGTTVSSTRGTIQIIAGNTLTTDSANGTTNEITTSGNVLLEAGLSVGSDSNRIELGDVSLLAARTLTNGAGSHLWLRKLGTTDDLEVGSVTVHNSSSTLDNAVLASGPATVANAVATVLKGLSTTANDGVITLTTQGGDLTITQAITAHGGGYVDLRTANAGNLGDMAINNGATVSSTSGVVQLIAGNTLTTDSANGTTTEIATTGNVLLEAGRSIGSDARRIELAQVSKVAGRTLGNGADSHLWLRKLGSGSDLEVGTVAVQNHPSLLDHSVSPTGQVTVLADRVRELRGLSTTAFNGNITLTTQGGDVAITQGVTAHGSGYVDIRTAGSGNLGDILIGNGATVGSTSGTIQLIAGNTLTTDSLNGSVVEISTSGHVLLEAGASIGTDPKRIELAGTSILAARTLANGNDNPLWLRKLGATSDLELGTVTVQNSASSLDHRVSPTGQTMVSGGMATALLGLSTTANNSAITLTTQGGDVSITQGITAHGSGSVDLRTAFAGHLGDIRIANGATVSSTGGTVQILAGNTLTTDSLNGTTTEIATEGSVLLEAGLSVGTDGSRIELGGVQVLAARTLDNGSGSDLWLRKLGALSDLEIGTVTAINGENLLDRAVSATGQTVVANGRATVLKGLSTTAHDGNITLTTQGGDLTITQGISAHGSGVVDLRTASIGHQGDVAITKGATIESARGTVQLVVGNGLTTDSANGTATEIMTLGSVLIEAGLNIGADTNRMELGGAAKVAARTLGNGSSGDIWLRKLGNRSNLEVGSVTVHNSASTLDQAVAAAGQATLVAGLATELKGISTTAHDNDVTLTTEGGDLTIAQNITAHGSGYVDLRSSHAGNAGDMIIDNNATIGSTTGTIQLVVGNSLTTTSKNGTGSEIATGGDVLLLVDSILGDDAHRIEISGVNSLAAESVGAQWLRQTSGNLNLGTVAPKNGPSTLDHAVRERSGLKTTNSSIVLSVAAGDLNVIQGVDAGFGDVSFKVSGSQALGADVSGHTVTLIAGADSSHKIIQKETGRLKATAVRAVAGGAITLDRSTNAIGTLAGSSGGTLTAVNGNDLLIGTLTTTQGSDALGTSTGLTATAGDVLLTVSGTLRQSSGSIVTTAATKGMGLWTTGTVTLEEANDLGLLAANVSGAGSGFSFTDAGDYALDTVGGVTGITLNGGSVVLKSTRGTISETGSAAVSAETLKLVAGGSARLTNRNHVNKIAGVTGSDLSYYDTGNLRIDSVDGTDGMTAGGRVWVRTGADLTTKKQVTGNGGDTQAVVLAATNAFYNDAGTDGVRAPNGRWLIYDDNLDLVDRFGGLLYTFRRLETWYDDYPPAGVTETGNGYLTTASVPDPEQYARQAGGATSAVATGNNSTTAVSLANAGSSLAATRAAPPVQIPATPPTVRPVFGLEGGAASVFSGVPLTLPVRADTRFVSDLTTLVPKGEIRSVGTTTGEPLPAWLKVDTTTMRVSGTPPEGSAPVSLRLQVDVPGQDAPQTIDIEVTPAQPDTLTQENEPAPSGPV